MNLTWHIIKKDIRRERAGLLVWATLFVAQVVIGYVLLHHSAGRRLWIDNMQISSAVLVGLQFLLCYALVARLVQADPLQGTDMFWATRPISGRRLLLAKGGAALLVFGLLPVLLRLPWWIGCGFTMRDVFWTAVNTVGWQLVVIAPAFLIASLTNEFPRVLLWSLLLFVGGMMGFGLLASLFNPGGVVGEGPLDYAGIHYTRIWLMAVSAVLLMGGLAAHHFLTRRLSRSLNLTVVGLGMVMIVGWFSSVNFSGHLASLTRPAYERKDMEAVASVRAEVGRGYPDPRAKSRHAETMQSLYTEIYFQGMPPDMSVATGGRGWQSWQSWTWADGTRIRRPSWVSGGLVGVESLLRQTYTLPEPPQDRETAEWIKEKQRQAAADRVVRGLKPPLQWKTVPPALPVTRQLVFTSAPSSLSKRALREPPAYEASLDCVALRPAIAAELPITVGAYSGENSLRIRIQGLKTEDTVNGLEASFVHSVPMIRSGGLWAVGEILPARDRNVHNLMWGRICSVNRLTGDVVEHGGYSLLAPRRALVAGVLLSWDQTRVGPRLVIRNGRHVPADPKWLEHTRLVFVAEKAVARFTAQLKSERVEFLPSRWLESEESGEPGSN